MKLSLIVAEPGNKFWKTYLELSERDGLFQIQRYIDPFNWKWQVNARVWRYELSLKDICPAKRKAAR